MEIDRWSVAGDEVAVIGASAALLFTSRGPSGSIPFPPLAGPGIGRRSVDRIALSPDGQMLACALSRGLLDPEIVFLDRSGRVLGRAVSLVGADDGPSDPNRINVMTFDASGRRLAMGTFSSMVRVLEAPSGVVVLDRSPVSTSEISDLAFSPGGDLAVAAGVSAAAVLRESIPDGVLRLASPYEDSFDAQHIVFAHDGAIAALDSDPLVAMRWSAPEFDTCL